MQIRVIRLFSLLILIRGTRFERMKFEYLSCKYARGVNAVIQA